MTTTSQHSSKVFDRGIKNQGRVQLVPVYRFHQQNSLIDIKYDKQTKKKLRMRHLVVPFVLMCTSVATRIASPEYVYETCSQVSVGGNGRVYTAVRFRNSETPKSCQYDEKLILKCASRDQAELISREFDLMNSLSSASWIPQIYEFFERVGGGSREPCIAMELLGSDLEKLRLAYTEGLQWSWVTLGSIGARMAETVASLHTDFGMTHTDLHAGNWMLTRSVTNSLSPTLKMIDFGDTRSLAANPDTAAFWVREEVRQIIISIRYLYDGDFKFYVWKRYVFNEAEICAGVPAILCDALKYVNDLAEGEPIDYMRIRTYMTTLVEEHGGNYTGQIIWEPVLTALGAPVFNPQPARPATDIAHDGEARGNGGPNRPIGADGGASGVAVAPRGKAGQLPVRNGSLSASTMAAVAAIVFATFVA